jgi:chromosomal replication initiator protein
MATFWQGVSSRLRERLGQVGFETWISPLSFVGIEGHTATLQAPNKFFRDWVNDRYLNDLRQCVSAETGADLEIALVAAQQDSKQDGVSQVRVSPPPARRQTSNSNPGGGSKP